jgi:uncharacterized membrane protein (UPF0136 family)
MDTTVLVSGAVNGAIFVLAAYAASRYTRQILAAGLVLAAAFYVYFAARSQMSAGWLATELLGVGVFGAMAIRGLRGSAWWIAAGWALHPLWDVPLHLFGPGHAFAPASYATACLTWDWVVAAVVALDALRGWRVGAAPALRTTAQASRGA